MAQFPSYRSFRHINAMSLAAGDRIEITSSGSFDQTLMLKGQGKTQGEKRSRLSVARNLPRLRRRVYPSQQRYHLENNKYLKVEK
jgi:hypothetical protein